MLVEKPNFRFDDVRVFFAFLQHRKTDEAFLKTPKGRHGSENYILPPAFIRIDIDNDVF